MHVVKVAGEVDLDVCDDHGAWFDRHELRRFIDALATPSGRTSSGSKTKNKRVVAAAAAASVAVVAADNDKLDTALEVADAGFSVLGLFGDLLGALD